LDYENIELTKEKWDQAVAKGDAGEFGFLPMIKVGDKTYQCT